MSETTSEQLPPEPSAPPQRAEKIAGKIGQLSIPSVVVFLIILTWLNPHPGDNLIFCSGIANLIAIIDIGRQPELDSEAGHPWLVRFILVAQVVFFAVVIGYDVNHIASEPVELIIAVVTALAIILVALVFKPARQAKITLLFFGIILILAIYLFPQLITKIKANLPDAMKQSQHVVPFIFARAHAWTHLILIPLVYLGSDCYLRRHLEISEKAFRLDVAIFFVGIACAYAGVRANDPLFEAGAAATSLLLGNWVYVTYVHKGAETPIAHPETAA